MPVPHKKFLRVPTLNPGSPISITKTKPGRIEFSLGEDLGQIGASQRATLHLQFKGTPPAKALRVVLNDTELLQPQMKGGWLEFSLSGAMVPKETTA